MKKGERLVFVIGLCFLLLLPFSGKAAEKFPTKTIELVVPFAAGGSTDVLARLVAKYAPKYFDKPLVVVNKPGGGGVTGTEGVVRSKPDGYTLYVGYGSGHDLVMPHFVGSAQLPKMPYDTFKDLLAGMSPLDPFDCDGDPGRCPLQELEGVYRMGEEEGAGDGFRIDQGWIGRYHLSGPGKGDRTEDRYGPL